MEQIPLKNLDRVRALIQTGQLTSVSSDYNLIDAVVADAREDLEAAKMLAEDFPKRSFTCGYDAGHKALGAFLQAQGWRTKASAGHHRLLIEVVTDEAPGLAVLLNQMRDALTRRNVLDYPTGPVEAPTGVELTEFLTSVARLVTGVSKLVRDRAIPLVRE